MPKAKKTKSGKYTIAVYDFVDSGGKKHYKRFTADTKKEAELLAAQYRSGHIREPVALKTLDKGLDEYINSRKNVCSPATIRGYKSCQKILLREFPEFMGRTINSITQTDMQFFVSQLSVNRSPKTVENYMYLIIPISDRFKDFNLTLPQIYQYEPYIPTEDEILTLLGACKGIEIELPIMLGAYCMMRRGEICSLEMRDVNFGNKTIHIRHSIVRDEDNFWITKQPKNRKSDRTIKVPDFVLAEIKKRGYITTLKPDQLTERFERKIRSLDLPLFRFHDLRHYCCSVFSLSCPLNYVKEYGGWSNIHTVEKIYQHTMRDKKDEIYGKMIDYFQKIQTKHN